MPLKSSFIILLILMPFLCLGQINYSASSIPANLKKGADAVIRNYSETITLEAQNKVVENVHVVVTILNEDGLYYGQHIVNYKSSTESVKVKDVILYDALGIKVKRLKKSDIKDIASFDNVSLISDERQKIISYTPVNYPATIEYSYTLQRKNSLHLCVFSPIPGFDVGVEKHELDFINNSSIAVEHKPYLLDEYSIKSLDDNKYIAEHIPPIKKEAYAPNYWSVFPKVYFRPTKFNYEGHEGTFKSWEDYGTWINNAFLEEENNLKKEDIPKELIAIHSDYLTDYEKVKLVYEYIQNNTRYILINLEDGGLKPMKSADVNKLKYGDCKALSFYMYSILKAIDIPIKYGVVYASSDHQISMDESFPNPYQANHIIVNIPLEEEDIWLDCTSTTNPFNFLGGFTDNRKVLLVDDQETIIKNTPDYGVENNKVILKSKVDLSTNIISIKKTNHGLKMSTPRFYSNQDKKTRANFFKQYYFGKLKSYSINKYETKEDQNLLTFDEQFIISSEYLQENVGGYLLISPSIYSFDMPSFKKTKKRKFPVEFVRNSIQEETIEYTIPEGYVLAEEVEYSEEKSPFGQYTQEVNLNGNQLLITRKLILEKNQFSPEDYQELRTYFKRIRTLSNKKITLKKA